MGATAEAGSKKQNVVVGPALAPIPRVVYVQITGSHIPQRVLLYGNQVNSASPLYVVQSNGLIRTGATTVAGIISLDPNITTSGPR